MKRKKKPNKKIQSQYFQQKYGIHLNYPHLPLAVGSKKFKGSRPFYPLELLHVADYQRVGNRNITSADVATIVKNRHGPPSRVVFYRSGCTEGSFGTVLRYEVPIINSVVKKYAPGAPITVIVPSKIHSFRFFKKDINDRARPDEQNVRPGTVIDVGAVSTTCCEFFLNSHLAIQGTAKTPKYSIIHHSEATVHLDMFERWTNALCYGFQIVTSPTSLPAPVLIATRYAERGRQIYNTFESSLDAALPGGQNGNGRNGNGQALYFGNGNGGNGNGAGGNVGDPKENEYYSMSLALNFTKQEFLRDKRVNA